MPSVGHRESLLHPDAPEWTLEAADAQRYGQYEDAIVQFALRRSGFLTLLTPVGYIRNVRG
jgi:hypothetical protein